MDNISDIHERVDSDQKTLTSLQELLREIKSRPQAFDDEDQSVVSGVIETVQTDLSQAEKDLAQAEKDLAQKKKDSEKRQKMYQSTVVRMEKALKEREQVFEMIMERTDLFERRPDLMKAFVDKQVLLTKSLEELKHKLTLE
jgi:multidrug resistance efflux pump